LLIISVRLTKIWPPSGIIRLLKCCSKSFWYWRTNYF